VEVIATGAVFLQLLAMVRPFAGFNICLSQVLIGAGDTRTSMLINLIGKWLVLAPAGYYVALNYGLNGVWYVFIAGIIIDGSAHFVAWMRRKWLSLRFVPPVARKAVPRTV
jgi:Na+-driven multidrug efflux pump